MTTYEDQKSLTEALERLNLSTELKTNILNVVESDGNPEQVEAFRNVLMVQTIKQPFIDAFEIPDIDSRLPYIEKIQKICTAARIPLVSVVFWAWLYLMPLDGLAAFADQDTFRIVGLADRESLLSDIKLCKT